MAKARNNLYAAIELSKTLKDARTLSCAYSTMVSIRQNSGQVDSITWYLQRVKNSITNT